MLWGSVPCTELRVALTEAIKSSNVQLQGF